MRGNFVFSMAQHIEELSRDEESCVGKYLKHLLYPCLSDKLIFPLRHICTNPIISIAVLLILYLVFLLIFAPLWLASFIVTSYGAFALFLVAFHYLAIFIGRSIAFPGCNSATVKQLSGETIRRLAEYLENTAIATNELTSSLMLVASGKLTAEQLQQSDTYSMEQIWQAVEYFPRMQAYFQEALETLKKEKALQGDEVKTLTQLISGMDDCFGTFRDLFSFFQSHRSRRLPMSPQTLLLLSSKCLQASEKVRTNAHALKPPRHSQGSEEENIMAAVKSLLSFASGLTGYEKVSFPYLRAILTQKHGAQSVRIKGSDNNLIDGVLLRASCDPRRPNSGVTSTVSLVDDLPTATIVGAANSTSHNINNTTTTNNNNNAGSNPVNSTTLVIFCSPNAGFYEGISQHNYEKSWFGYYLGLGMDVFVYNYRGYGQSGGMPSPAALKRDAVHVVQHLQRVLRPQKILVHGESIGGLVACHLAATFSSQNSSNSSSSSGGAGGSSVVVAGLICDRTFASLDSTAARLLGSWAGLSLRYLVGWQTDTVAEYLQASCAKLVLQDPNDEIIAEPASLRVGIASTLLYGQLTRSPPTEPADYPIARYLQHPLPRHLASSADVLSGMIAEDEEDRHRLSSPSSADANLSSTSSVSSGSSSTGNSHAPVDILSPAFVAHVYAACRHLLERALPAVDTSGTTGSSANRRHAEEGEQGGGDMRLSSPLLQIELIQRKGGHVVEESSHSSVTGDGDEESGVDHHHLLNSTSTHNASSEADALLREQQQQRQQQKDLRANQSIRWTRRLYLDSIVGVDLNVVHNSSGSRSSQSSPPSSSSPTTTHIGMNAHHYAYLAVARIDSASSGQYLGESLHRGLDGFSAWLACYIVWHHPETLYLSSTATAVAGKTFEMRHAGLLRAIADLEQLSQRYYAVELGRESAVSFLIGALRAILRKCQRVEQYWQQHHLTSLNDLEGNRRSPAFQPSSLSLPTSCTTGHLNEAQRVDWLSHPDVLGHLLPLNCGHNGWPADAHMDQVTKWLREQNIIPEDARR